MFKLYYGDGSCALASHLTLQEAGADYQAIAVDLAAGEQRQPDFLKLNPKGRVPALVTEHGILTETPAVLIYIAQRFPSAGLAPLDDAFAFAQVQSFNSYLCSTVHVAHAHAARGSRWTDNPVAIEAMKEKVSETMTACFDAIESSMVQGPWVMGSQFTVCDPYLYTLSRWLKRDGVDVRQFPKVAAIYDAIEKRPAAGVVLPRHTR